MAYITRGNRGGQVLVNQGFRYQRNQTRKEKIYWRCWQEDCRAFLHTTLDLTAPIEILHESVHNHAETDDFIQESNAQQQILESVAQDPSQPIKRLYDELSRNINHVPEFKNIKSSMNRRRQLLVPPIPRDVQDVTFDGQWAQCWNGENFIIDQDNDWGIVVFGTEENLRTIQRCSTIYVDGTFKSCPSPYSQMVTLHGKLFGRVLPLVVALMTGKTIAQYRYVFRSVKTAVRQATGHRFRPRQFICDFEMAIIAAIESELNQSSVSGCYFHFCQSMWRKVQELGLSGEYRQNERLRMCLRKFFSIGHLPLALVCNNFVLHSSSNQTRRLIRRYPALRRFINYMQMNYIDGNFPPRLWNVYARDMDTRTNNHVECKLVFFCLSQHIVLTRNC